MKPAPSYLTRNRHGTFYFRMVIPAPLRPLVNGKREVRRSLKTDSFWPLSIPWDPVSGHDAAESINYTATKAHVSRLQRKELDALDERLQSGQLDVAQYTLEKRKVDKKYDFN